MEIDTTGWNMQEPIDPNLLLEIEAEEIIAQAQGYYSEEHFLVCFHCGQDHCIRLIDWEEIDRGRLLYDGHRLLYDRLLPLYDGQMLEACLACGWVRPY